MLLYHSVNILPREEGCSNDFPSRSPVCVFVCVLGILFHSKVTPDSEAHGGEECRGDQLPLCAAGTAGHHGHHGLQHQQQFPLQVEH